MSINNIVGAAIAGNQVLQRNQQQADGGKKELKYQFYTEIDVFSMDTSCPDYANSDEAHYQKLKDAADPNKQVIKLGLRPVDKALGTEAASGQASARRTGNV